MKPIYFLKDRLLILCALAICTMHGIAFSAVTDLANGPLANGNAGSTAIKPNVAFIVDDSGSMDEENMPDDDSTNRSNRCFGWKGYNTVFYDPTYIYRPPFKLDGTPYSSGPYADDVTRYPDASFTEALKDGYFAHNGYTYGGNNGSNTKVNLASLSNLTPNSVSCTETSNRAPVPASARIVFPDLDKSEYYATSLKVDGVELLDASAIPNTNGTTSENTLGQAIADSINRMTNITGYSADYSDRRARLTITAPASKGNLTSTPVLVWKKVNDKDSSKTFTVNAFSGYEAGSTTIGECPSSPSRYYYSKHKTNPKSTSCEASSNYDIVTDKDRIEAPGIPVLGESGTGRTAEEIAAAQTNYANWYSYYRKRAYLMKAAAGEAFKDLDESKYRIGLFYINSTNSGAGSTNSDLKIDDFIGSNTDAQRFKWFKSLYGARKDGWTPLRGALSRAGMMFAGKISGFDPVQYSCQQNFAILSTDGYWNNNSESSSYGAYRLKLDGENSFTAVGNQDGTGGSYTATIVFDDFNGTKYYASTLKVDGRELLAAGRVPDEATSNTNSFGAALVSSIASKGSGYTATYDNISKTLIITAPSNAGDLSAVSPALTMVKDGTGTNRDVSISSFSKGTRLPYLDKNDASNTLADIAYYYYQTDLRTPNLGNCSNTIGDTTYTELCENNVLGSGRDVNSQQHMTTFTVGLGVSGTIKYENDYENAPDISGVTQYFDVKNGTAKWPNPGSSDPNKIDDLWHAAVNGRGTYYSASNAQTLKDGLLSALSGVQTRTGSSSAAATSNLEPVNGDNYVYVALYRTAKWDGDLKAFEIDPATGALSGAELWSAKEILDTRVSSAAAQSPSNDVRSIKFLDDTVTPAVLKEFNSANLPGTELAYFENICGRAQTIDQCGTDGNDLTATQKATANSADTLINYLRGRPTYEDEASNATTANRIFRGREHVLGDIVNAVPVYVKKPPFGFADSTYTAFKAAEDDREGTVYVAANDGMLHAFNAENGDENLGEERWAYIPKMVMPNMWKLADRNYENDHRYYVDGSPTVADVCIEKLGTTSETKHICKAADKWKTILVGGLNKGGCGYYAMDVTDPDNPVGMWEFTNADLVSAGYGGNLGYSYGNPIVAKNKDGRWVVIVSSGYNNYPGGCGTTGDGNGHLYVLDAYTGQILQDIPTYTSGTTPAGTTGAPSNLGKLNAWIENADHPVAERIYGGDMLGNVWRFDFDNNTAPSGAEAVLLAQLKDGTGNSQPITTKPELAVVNSNLPVILVGTGRYLHNSDTDPAALEQRQSIYALKDKLEATGISDVRSGNMKERTLTQTTGNANGTLAGRTIRTITGESISWGSHDGWYFDLDPNGKSPGERVNVDMSLQFNLLTVPANVPETNACSIGGYGLLYFIDINTGLNLSTAAEGMAGIRLSSNALIAGIKTVKLTSGKTVTIVTDTAGNVDSEDNPSPPGGGGGGARRTTWRELID